MSELKTKPTQKSVTTYINDLNRSQKRDARRLLAIFKEVTNTKPVLWGDIVGFGQYHYIYDSGREGDCFATGFAMRKGGPTVYIMPGYGEYGDILKRIGPHKLGKSCLYLTRVDDTDENALKKLIRTGLRDLKKAYPVTL